MSYAQQVLLGCEFKLGPSGYLLGLWSQCLFATIKLSSRRYALVATSAGAIVIAMTHRPMNAGMCTHDLQFAEPPNERCGCWYIAGMPSSTLGYPSLRVHSRRYCTVVTICHQRVYEARPGSRSNVEKLQKVYTKIISIMCCG
jgi:hypothetical protein